MNMYGDKWKNAKGSRLYTTFSPFKTTIVKKTAKENETF